MKSIIQDKKECLVCGSWNVEEHCIFSNKKELSDKYGLKVWLCPTHLNLIKNSNNGKKHKLGNELDKLGQKAFEWKHTRNEFVNLFDKNYL